MTCIHYNGNPKSDGRKNYRGIETMVLLEETGSQKEQGRGPETSSLRIDRACK